MSGEMCNWKRNTAAALMLLGFVSVVAMAGCGDRKRPGEEVTLVLGAYTTPREAYGRAILPGFQRHWQQKTGQTVRFRESYLASGAQSRAVIGGFEADIVALSLEADVERIAAAGLIRHDWKSRPHGGMVSNSIVVFAVRSGNPRGIKDWSDLASPGLNVLTPDPRTSGGAMWNICAMYGAALRGFISGVPKEDPQAAAAFIKRVFQNVSIMDKGARESVTNFERGVGDLAITYENEVLVGWKAGQIYEYVIPRSTILIQNPAAVVDSYVDKHGVREVAEAFLAYLWSSDAQHGYAQFGLRPVDSEVDIAVRNRYPPVEDLWSIDYLGGWQEAVGAIFGPEGVYTRMYRELHGAK